MRSFSLDELIPDNLPRVSKDPNNRVPLKGVIGGYIGEIWGLYKGPRTQIIVFGP